MSDFEVTVLGVGDTFTERHFSSALLLSSGGFNLAIDCPDSYRKVLASARAHAHTTRPLDLLSLDHILITHVHGDHMNGLEGAAFFKHFVQGKRVELVTSQEVRDEIWEHRLRAAMAELYNGREIRTLGFDDYFVHRPLAWDGAVQVGPFSIRARRTLHHVPTSALLVEACGRTLGYSADTAFDPELIAFLEPADLIIHETNYGPAHTAFSALLTLPDALQRKLRVIHYPDEFDPGAARIRPVVEGEILRV